MRVAGKRREAARRGLEQANKRAVAVRAHSVAKREPIQATQPLASLSQNPVHFGHALESRCRSAAEPASHENMTTQHVDSKEIHERIHRQPL